MRIGIICYPTFGGSGVIATELGMFLARRGHQVHFITYSQPVRLDIMEPNIYYHEVNVQDYPLFQYQPYELALSSKMVNVAMKYKLDILHAHYAIPHAYAAYTAKQILREASQDIKVMTTLHGTDITLVGKNPSYRPAVNFSINQSDVVTSVSASLKTDTLNFFDIQRPISVIPNFVDLDLYKPGEDCVDNFSEAGEKVITHVSNFREVKRTEDVIAIFHKILREVPAVLLMLGEGPTKERTRQKAIDMGIGDKVKFLGKTSEVERILCISDLFVLPSATESFGLAALEAMAAGVPVVSTNAGGLPEVNIQGETGYTADVANVSAMAHYGIKILRDEAVHRGFCRRARQHAETFSIQHIGPIYESIYQKAAAGEVD